MKPAPNTLTQIDNLPGEEIEFGIGDPRWVMRTQAELYSDVTTAIIREYSTNAYDAHVMAGHSDPIEVTLPSIMNPFFVIKDHGVGMDMDLFRRVYTQFGVSDKRESNDTNGMLGYGSKSGVAYTTSFSVTSVRNGNKVHGVVMRKPDWSIVLKVISQTKTDEPNGTEIRIPVHNVDEFNHKAREFYKFWLPGRVTINGKAVEHHVGEKIADNLYHSKDWNTSYVVMGNVAYRIENPDALFRNTKMNRVNFVAYVDDFKTEDGSAPVEFVPSREDLKYTERTKSTLQAIINDFEKKIFATAQKQIAAASNHFEAFVAWQKWTESLGRAMFADLEYKGDKFQSQFSINAHRYQRNSTYNSVYRIPQWNVEAMPRTMVVTEFDINMSSSVKQKANEYVKIKGWNITYILFTASKASDINSKWIVKDQFVRWEDLKAAIPKKPKAPKTGVNNNPNTGRVAGSWDYITSTGMTYEQPIPTDKTELFYITVKTEKGWAVRSILQNLGMKDTAVLVVPANRLGKLTRENPDIKEFTEFAKSKVVVEGGTLLDDDGKAVMDIDHNTRRWIDRLDVNRLDDPAIAKAADLIKREDALTKRYRENLDLARLCHMWYTVKEYSPKSTNYIVTTYPLLGHMGYGRIHNHIYVYMNAAYAADKENDNDK